MELYYLLLKIIVITSIFKTNVLASCICIYYLLQNFIAKDVAETKQRQLFKNDELSRPLCYLALLY